MIEIDGRLIGAGQAPYVVAELSGNHNGSLESARKLIDVAKSSGADAVKLQTYTPDTITLDSNLPDFQINEGLWKGRTLHELYEWAHTPWEWHKPLFDYARKREITLFSSPFDRTALDLLEDLNAPAYKIASFELIDTPLIEYVASTGKPMILSTGMADREEIAAAVDAARGAGCRELVLLHCVSGYPAPPEDYNLQTMVDMTNRFNVPVGLSDHTLDNTTAIAAVALGACLVEKHITLDRQGGGPDDSFSLEPDDLRNLCSQVRAAWSALGSVDYGRKSSEQSNVKFRRSLYYVKNLAAGDYVTADAVRSVRPGYGAPPAQLGDIIGRRVRVPVGACTPVREDHFS